MSHKKYIRGKPNIIAILAIVIYFTIALLITAKIINHDVGTDPDDYNSALTGAVVLWGVVILLLFAMISGIKANLQYEKELENKGRGAEFREKDFNSTLPFFDDTVRVGQYFLFLKRSGCIIPLEEVTRIQRGETVVIKDRKTIEYYALRITLWQSDLKPFHLPSYKPEEWERFTEALSFAAPEIKIDQSINKNYC